MALYEIKNQGQVIKTFDSQKAMVKWLNEGEECPVYIYFDVFKDGVNHTQVWEYIERDLTEDELSHV